MHNTAHLMQKLEGVMTYPAREFAHMFCDYDSTLTVAIAMYDRNKLELYGQLRCITAYMMLELAQAAGVTSLTDAHLGLLQEICWDANPETNPTEMAAYFIRKVLPED